MKFIQEMVSSEEVIYLLVMLFIPVLRVEPQPIEIAADRGDPVPEPPPCREDVSFEAAVGEMIDFVRRVTTGGR